MHGFIHVNGGEMPWKEGMRLSDLFRSLGYSIASPPVLVRVDDELIARSHWNGYVISEGVQIDVLNVLRGG